MYYVEQKASFTVVSFHSYPPYLRNDYGLSCYAMITLWILIKKKCGRLCAEWVDGIPSLTSMWWEKTRMWWTDLPVFSVRAALDSDFGICPRQNRGRRRRTEKTGKSVHHIRVFSHHIDIKDGSKREWGRTSPPLRWGYQLQGCVIQLRIFFNSD